MELTTAPRHAEIIRAFVNTRDLEDGTEALADGAALTAWLGEQGLRPPGAVAGDGDAELARDLREALRDLLTARHDDAVEPAAQRRLDALAADLPLRVDFSGEPPVLAPLRAGLAAVLAAVGQAAADGSWSRLKVCPADDCRWAFYDTSRNRSRTWCSMQVCGNRTKTRAYRARRHV